MLATPDDVAARLRRSLTDDEQEWIDGPLLEASIAVEAFCGQQFVDPVPDAVVMVTSRIASRAVSNKVETGQAGLQQTAGVYSTNTPFTAEASSGGVWMTKQDKRDLRMFKRGGGAFSINTAPYAPDGVA